MVVALTRRSALAAAVAIITYRADPVAAAPIYAAIRRAEAPSTTRTPPKSRRSPASFWRWLSNSAGLVHLLARSRWPGAPPPFQDIPMTNVVAFTPRPRQPEPAAPAPLAGLALRIRLEEAAQTALDAADKIIAALDGIEDAAEPEATETASAPRSAMSVQVVRLEDQESFRTTIAQAHTGAREETPSLVMADQGLKSPQDKVPTEASSIETAEVHTLFPSLPWGGAGNVVSAAGCAVLALVGMRA